MKAIADWVLLPLGLALYLALTLPRAHAQPQELRQAAARVAKDGQVLYEAGRYAEALDRFQEAQRVYPSTDLLVYIATTLLSLQRDHEALGALLEFFPDAPKTTQALRILALRVWSESSEQARSDLVGHSGERLGTAIRKRLATVDPNYLPPELRGLVVPVEPVGTTTKEDPPAIKIIKQESRLPLWPGILLGGAGMASTGVGIALLSLHGQCASPGTDDTCPTVYETRAGGGVLVALGGVLVIGGSAWLLRVGLGRKARPAKSP